MEKRYMYRRKDGMEVYRDRIAPWLKLKGYEFIGMVNLRETKNVKG